MTRADATEKAAALTAEGQPTVMVRDVRLPGGFCTRDATKDPRYNTSGRGRARARRFNKSPKGQRRATKYNKTEKCRARTARVRLGRSSGQRRLSRDGIRFRQSDWDTLFAEQRGLCFVCGEPLEGALRDGRRNSVVEHGHGDGFVRSLTHGYPCNTLLACFEALKVPVHELPVFVTRIMAALWMPWLGMSEAEARRARRRAKKVPA